MTFCTSDFITDRSIASYEHFLVDPGQRQVGHPLLYIIACKTCILYLFV